MDDPGDSADLTTTLAWLRSPAGAALLHQLAAQPLRDRDLLATVSHLRQHYPLPYARAAVEQTLLRQRAHGKIAHADQLFFIRAALEQASSAPVAAYRARLLPPASHIADMGCGIGGDSLVCAAHGHTVTAYDHDHDRLCVARANAAILGVAAQVTFVHADVRRTPPPAAATVVYCDPARRDGLRRHFTLAAASPPLPHVLAWLVQHPALLVKLSPGIDRAELDAVLQAAGNPPVSCEFVALNGDLKECLLRCGTLAEATPRATLLHTAPAVPNAPASYAATVHSMTATPAPTPPTSAPLAYLYEPDPAVIRAGLVAQLAASLGAAQLDPQIAYLTATHAQPTPFARVWRIREWLPFQRKRLRARLRALDAGEVTVKKRGSPLDTDALARELRGTGSTPLVVVLTHVEGTPAALVCDPPGVASR